MNVREFLMWNNPAWNRNMLALREKLFPLKRGESLTFHGVFHQHLYAAAKDLGIMISVKNMGDGEYRVTCKGRKSDAMEDALVQLFSQFSLEFEKRGKYIPEKNFAILANTIAKMIKENNK